jgi:hypothetical protein
MKTAPSAMLERVCDFLGVPRSDFDTRRIEKLGTDIGPMPEGPQARLRDIYAVDVREVEALLGWDCGDWLA